MDGGPVPDVTPAPDSSVAAVGRALDILRRRLTPRGMRRVSASNAALA
jgi:hypothetical protein